MFKLTRKTFYIILFSILWLITAFSSFFHAVEFFELSNVTWMGIILAMAFEIGQASVLMSILTSQQDRKKYTPWILMCILTLVQIIGNVYSSYKYIMLNSPENLKYFKEPIFIWTNLPDAEATVIITYVSAAILPIVALLMTSMITNYLSDQEELKKLNNKKQETSETEETIKENNKKIDTNIHEDNINTEEDQDNDQENTEQINYEDINISEEPISIIEDKDNIKEEIQETEIKGSEDSEKQEDNYDYENKVISYEDQNEKVDNKIEDQNEIEDNKKEDNKKESHFINLNK